MIDTHTHLYMTGSFPDGGETAVRNAIESGVSFMVLPAVDRESIEPMIALNRKFPINTGVALGLHPTEVKADWKDEIREILDHRAEVEIIGIGETGIDLYWDKKNLIRQMDAFGEQIQLARDLNLPLIIHSRDALNETREALLNFSDGLPSLVFHSFTAGIEEAEKLLETAPDAYFGINGVITFKNANPLREAVRFLNPDKIVTETDSPFLAPVPFRGKTNESLYIPYIISAIAAVKNIPEEEVQDITNENALRLFPSIRTVISPN